LHIIKKKEDIERVMGLFFTRLRINLLAIPKGVAPQIVDEKNSNVIAKKIDERIRRALSEVVTLDIEKIIENEG
jgi:hypothetical protein